MRVFRPYAIVDGEMVTAEPWPARSEFQPVDVFMLLSNFTPSDDPAPINWQISVKLSKGPLAKPVTLDIERFLSTAAYAATDLEPQPFASLDVHGARLVGSDDDDNDADWIWMFRSGIYVTTRRPRRSESGEVSLKIKAHHFRIAESLRRLREEVANFEAAEGYSALRAGRQPIPDDVKLAIWARDCGKCVKCGSAAGLHFDHIIPFSRGGNDTVENLQILCRPCNLSKSDRLV